MRHHIKIDLKVRFTSKWHAGSGEAGPLVDRMIRKDVRGLPYIPGSTLKGIIRENCEKLCKALGFPPPSNPHERDLTIEDTFYPLSKLKSPVDRLFGNNYQGSDLFFRDARLEDKPPYHFLRQQSRIQRYRLLGTVKDRHLFTSEYAEPMELAARIEGWHEDLRSFDEGDPPVAYCLLVAAILKTDRIGGDKSTGAGNVEISIEKMAYNGEKLEGDKIFEYLDADLYEMEEGA